jgi:hypothetical protein
LNSKKTAKSKKLVSHKKEEKNIGGGKGSRTLDPLLAKQMLYP